MATVASVALRSGHEVHRPPIFHVRRRHVARAPLMGDDMGTCGCAAQFGFWIGLVEIRALAIGG
jgi:hypothetical protein